KSSSQHWGKSELIGQLTLKNLWETPCAEPHAGCCGGWGLETPGYPIMRFFKMNNLAKRPKQNAI
ncbi:MAG: hypothetical protein RPU59_10470, partial [Candidatus Sedimenticola sp. (ex Thyasira tokunagai)]